MNLEFAGNAESEVDVDLPSVHYRTRQMEAQSGRHHVKAPALIHSLPPAFRWWGDRTSKIEGVLCLRRLNTATEERSVPVITI